MPRRAWYCGNCGADYPGRARVPVVGVEDWDEHYGKPYQEHVATLERRIWELEQERWDLQAERRRLANENGRLRARIGELEQMRGR